MVSLSMKKKTLCSRPRITLPRLFMLLSVVQLLVTTAHSSKQISSISFRRSPSSLAFLYRGTPTCCSPRYHQTRSSFSSSSSTTELYSTSLITPDPSPDEYRKWENMYQEGGKKGIFDEPDDGTPNRYAQIRSEVKVVTFDLDDTLWKTTSVINAANDALAEYLNRNDIQYSQRVEVVMRDLFQKDRARYCPELNEETESPSPSSSSKKTTTAAPVLLTQLRKDAIASICLNENDFNETKTREFADMAFDVWLDARHEAIPNHYASSVVSCLQRIRQIKTSKGHPVVVGAITDGNSDPRNVPVLEDLFDFVVSAESVGVAKPDKKVYTAAIARVAQMPALQDLFAGFEELTEDLIDDVVGPWWVHVGDDFLKDVVAAKELKMRSIWSRELVQSKYEPIKTDTKETKEKKKKDVADLVKELSEMKMVEMTIGAEDFLADAMLKEFADATVDKFDDVTDILMRWHEDALSLTSTGADEMEKEESETMTKTAVPVAEVQDFFEVVMPSKEEPLKQKAVTSSPLVADTKFCVYCGEKLPNVAKFCSSCGEKQPEIK